MTARDCAELAELRSAYVDGALGDADRERLLTHLVDCVDCRRDVAELRHIRSLLTGSTDPGFAPLDLSHRLVSIAGSDADEPMWTRPFRRTAAGGSLPSKRHLRRTRALAVVVGCGIAVLSVLGVGYVAAPSATAVGVVDPVDEALAEFTGVVSGLPLDGRASAILQGREPTETSGGNSPFWVTLPAKKLSETKAAALLAKAGRAGEEATYTGRQVVTLSRDGERVAVSALVASRGGAGTEISPDPSASATVDAPRYIEADSSSRMADADLIDELADRYALRGWKAQWLVGRNAYVVEAVEPTSNPADGKLNGVAARWWIDTETHLLVGLETFDGRGNVVVSSRLADLELDAVPDDELAPSTQPATRTTTSLTTSRAEQLRRDGWICADQLAGLPLQRLRTDSSDKPQLVHLVYSDGLTTLSVVEQRGRLAASPRGTARNETLGAWVTDGLPSTASWTSGDVVLTAVTDGSRDTLVAAVAALPHRSVDRPTTMERVRAGWARILGR